MYVLQEVPDKVIAMGPDSTGTPLATLKDGCGAFAHIVEDDHCFVLVLGGQQPQQFATHWFKEAAEALCGILKATEGDSAQET